MAPDLTADDVVKLLADGDRLLTVAALVLGAGSIAEVVERTDLEQRDVSVAVSRLVAAGLVERADHGLRVTEELVRIAARTSPRHHDETPDHPFAASADLRAFVSEGRLVAIPTRRHKLLQVLDLVAQDFELGHRYSERQVNEMLCRWHPDVATLRRYLVDFSFLDREGGGGTYWRSGGSTDITTTS